MQPYNIEVFGRDFTLKQHFNAESIDYAYDYMSMVENSVYLPYVSSIEKGDYVRVTNNVNDYFGVVDSLVIDEVNIGYCILGFKPFTSIFDADILFDVTDQEVGTLEAALGAYITDNWVNNTDTSQNISGLEIETISETSDWTFYITSESDFNKTIVSFMGLLQEALAKYRVGLYIVPNIGTHKIKVQIGVMTVPTFTIEADLPNVIERSIIVNKTKSDINKLVVYSTENYIQSVVYYLHPDGSYDTTDSDRITPVIYQMMGVEPTEDKALVDLAREEADKLFGNNLEKNLIELRVINEDELVRATSLEVGRSVNVISNGITYQSILTGYEISDTTKLIFGTVRVDLTKILKEALK